MFYELNNVSKKLNWRVYWEIEGETDNDNLSDRSLSEARILSDYFATK